jgi:hypothetical protein
VFAYNWTNLSNVLVIFPIFFVMLQTRHGLLDLSIVGILKCMCTHPIDLMGDHLLHCAHNNKCIRTYDAIHDNFVAICMRCWLPHGMRTTTCVSFNHVQFLSLMSRHCVHQKCNLDLSWRYHCQNQCERIYFLNLV